MTGILLIAVGHKNYTRMASMLAMSIRANGCELPICLATDVNQVDEHYKQYFDQYVDVPDDYMQWRGSQCYIKVKAHMNDLTPFDTTLFIDSDVIMVNNGMLNDFIKELEGVSFTVKNSGFKNFGSIGDDEMQWANLKQIKEAYGFINEPIWNVHSEFVWWDKSMTYLFERWKENFDDLRVDPINFAGCVPDELPLYIAMAELNVAPHKSMYQPIFWPMDKDNEKMLHEVRKDYCGVSIGGKFVNGQMKSNYDNLCKIYQRMLGLPYIYMAQPKKRWLTERQNY